MPRCSRWGWCFCRLGGRARRPPMSATIRSLRRSGAPSAHRICAPSWYSARHSTPPAATGARGRATCATPSSLFVERLLELSGRHAHVHAGALFLQRHRDAEIALDAALELLARQLAELHRHAVLFRELEREHGILVGEPQRKGRRIELSRQVILGEAVEGALASARALPDGAKEREGFDARLHAE